MAGYASRTQPASGKFSDLYVCACAWKIAVAS